MFENFLKKNEAELKEVNVRLSPELQVYFLDFCEENSIFFDSVENSLKLIIVDNQINSKDIPELLNLIVKIYILIKNKKQLPNIDPYEIIELMLRILFISYIIPLVRDKDVNNVETVNQMVEQLLKIVKVAIELLRLPTMKVNMRSCFGCIFNK